MFEETLRSWKTVQFQWVHSHDGSKGNEPVDKLANIGMEWVQPGASNESWKFYTKKAVNTEIPHY